MCDCHCLMFLKVDDYIIVNGKVKLKNSAKQIVLKDDGVLESLHVKDGDFVQKERCYLN